MGKGRDKLEGAGEKGETKCRGRREKRNKRIGQEEENGEGGMTEWRYGSRLLEQPWTWAREEFGWNSVCATRLPGQTPLALPSGQCYRQTNTKSRNPTLHTSIPPSTHPHMHISNPLKPTFTPSIHPSYIPLSHACTHRPMSQANLLHTVHPTPHPIFLCRHQTSAPIPILTSPPTLPHPHPPSLRLRHPTPSVRLSAGRYSTVNRSRPSPDSSP